jgi:lipoate---protein ligase
MPTWRYIPLLAAAGNRQMQIDLTLFEQHLQGQRPPTLRFYTWEPAAISLGYHQHHYPDDWQHVSWQGRPVDVVRRPTGGRAVLHQGDLTYAVITSGLPKSRRAGYETICQFLIEGWRSLGVTLNYGGAERGYIHNPNCFGSATAADLVLPDGTKLIGSAQLRRGDGVLQHGSIRLRPDTHLFQAVFGVEAKPIPNAIAELPISTIVTALQQAAQTCFKVDFEPEVDW